MNSKIFTALMIALFAFAKADAQLTTTDDKNHQFGIGLNGGITVGDFEDIYSSNIGIDLYYLYSISEKFYLGGTTGFTNYFGEDVFVPSLGEVEFDDAQFIPIAGSLRFTPFERFAVGADIGYAIGLNDGNEGGFYASPRATYFIADKFPVFAGYRLIDLDGESLGSIQVGFGLAF
ncbi:hypothetical protein [Croceiramulus getboli]|nr:hypothetical protein P8624_06805 [Flavobacteriaceae bacterium YJPT1-3]